MAILCGIAFLSSCNRNGETDYTLFDYGNGPFAPRTASVSDSLPSDTKAASVEILRSEKGKAVIHTDECRGVVVGIGSSLTESSAYVLACLDPQVRHKILSDCFSADGANFPITRTHIGACDFSVEGKYSLCEEFGDTLMETFSLEQDKLGFTKDYYRDVVSDDYGLYHLIKEVSDIKKPQRDKTLRIVATAWTPPSWMKDIDDFYSKELRTGGKLLPYYYKAYARYLLRYVEDYNAEGVKIWAISPANEPQGNDGNWESVHITPSEEARLIGGYIGPMFEEAGYGSVKLLGFDQNTFEAAPYAEAIYGDSAANHYTSGLALHWYGSTISSFPDVMDSLHALYPNKLLLHTEGCIDNLGCDAWDAVTDPAGFKESGWFKHDNFWWGKNATDWAYSTPYWPELHPKYVPVHRYARYIIEGMNHYMTSFIDWNVVLDSEGGPNHEGNFCGAPIMVDTSSKEVYYTPVYYLLKLLSRNIRPGDKTLYVSQIDEYGDDVVIGAVEKADGKGYAVSILNTLPKPLTIPLLVGNKEYKVKVSANSVTVAKISK